MGRPVFVRTDPAGNIYVADALALHVKVYDPAGRYLRTIGGRGRGPGELLDITTMHLDRRGQLIIADELSKRITRFSLEGEVIATQPTASETMLWPRRLHDLDDTQYVFLYKLPNTPNSVLDSDYLFHLYDTTLTRKTTFFGSKYDVASMENAFIHELAESDPGRFWVKDPQTILYAPGVYDGEILQYQFHEGSWQQGPSLQGIRHSLPYQTFSEDEAHPKDIIEIHVGGGKVHRGKINSESIGLFTLKNNDIVHFSLQLQEGTEQKEIVVEVFGADGVLKGIGNLEEWLGPVDQSALAMLVHFSWKDAQDRLYFIDWREIPVVRIIELAY